MFLLKNLNIDFLNSSLYKSSISSIAVGDVMFLGMQDFNFAQSLITFAQSSPKLRPNFAQIYSNFAQILHQKIY